MSNNDAPSKCENRSEVASDEESYFSLNVRVRHDEMAQWSQERLATFFEAVSVLMAAKTQSKMPARQLAGASGAGAAASAAVEERMQRIEQTVDGVRRHVKVLHESMAEDMKTFEDNLADNTNAIQSTRTAMNQTDDLVERVVEALEVMQTSNLAGPQEHPAGIAAVN